MNNRLGQDGNSKVNQILDSYHVGEIVSISDPKFIGRIKADIKGVFSSVDGSQSIDFDMAPWIYPEMSSMNVFHTPKVGDMVIIWFDKDLYHGRYRSYERVGEDLTERMKDDYEGFKSIVYDPEEELEISYSRKKGIIIDLGGSTIKIGKKNKKISLSYKHGESILELSKDGVSIESSNISLGKIGDSNEPAVLGDKAAEQLTALWKAIGDTNKVIADYHDKQGTVVGSVSILSPMKAAHLMSQVKVNLNIIKNLNSSLKVNSMKSKVITVK